MKNIVQEIVDWSEVWALLIPIFILLVRKPKGRWVRPLKYYLLLALVINLTGNILWKRRVLGIEEWMQEHVASLFNADGSLNNTIFYNLHSIFRFMLFAWFFHYMGKTFRRLNTIMPAFALLLALVLFTLYKDIRDFNSLLLASEAAVLLFYCLLYYFLILRDEESNIRRLPPFWAVTGLSIYVVINFPIFLFYTVLAEQSEKFAINIWDVHNLSYILFSLFIAKSFYAASIKY